MSESQTLVLSFWLESKPLQGCGFPEDHKYRFESTAKLNAKCF
jgi:hypothetical protein